MKKRKKVAAATAVAPFDRRLMEKMMRDVSALVAERQPGSIDEANAIIQQALSQGGIPARAEETLSPLERAQDLMYEAYDASGKDRIDLALEALAVSRDCVDAYVFLAEEAATSLDEAKDMYQKGVHIAEQLLGPAFFKENEGHFWGILETRPYMRARLGLAQCRWTMGQRSEAIGHYKEMLQLNPNDNQGIRDTFAVCLLEENMDEPLGDLLKRYKEDASAMWRYTTALWTFRKEGATEKAAALLKEAVNENGFVPGYLLGVKKLPRRLPDYIGLGDEPEAIAYAANALEGWKRTQGALEWLTKTLQSTRRR